MEEDSAPRDGSGAGGAAELVELVGLRLRLRSLTDADVPFVRALGQAEANAALVWPMAASSRSEEEFQAGLHRGVLAHFLVLERRGERPIGYAVADRADLQNGFAYIGVFLPAEHQGRGLGAEAGGLLLRHLFERYGLRKVYGTAYETSLPNRGWGRLFREEACLREHCWFDGRYRDEHVLAIHRRDFDRIAGRFLDTLAGRRP